MNLRQPVFISLGLLVLTGIVVFQFPPRNDPVFAQDQETLSIMERIETLVEGTGSYHAEVKTVTTKKGETSVTNGRMKFKWPNMRWEENRHSTKRGIRIGLIISNGEIRWNYMPSLKFAYKHDLKALDEDARLKGWASAGYFEEGSIQYLGIEQLEKEKVYVFEGTQSALKTPKNSNHPGKSRVYFSIKDGIPRKIVLYDHQGQETGSQIFSNIRKDLSISAKDFEFTPPEGTNIFEVKDVGPRARN